MPYQNNAKIYIFLFTFFVLGASFFIHNVALATHENSSNPPGFTLSAGPEPALSCGQTVSSSETYSDESWRLLFFIVAGGNINTDDVTFLYKNGNLFEAAGGSDCSGIKFPSELKCSKACAGTENISISPRFLDTGAPSPDSVIISGTAYETYQPTELVTDVAFSGFQVEVLWKNCHPSQKTEDGQCVDITGTITATPPSCTAPCNVTADWTSNALSYGRVYKNGVDPFLGLPNDSHIWTGLTAGSYQFCLNGDDGFSTEVNVIDESTGQQACDTVTVVPPAPITHTLTVASTNPVSGVGMVNSPDKTGQSNGTTQYSLVYNFATGASVTAPSTAPNGNIFSSWTGCDSPASDPLCSVTMNSSRTITANYAVSAPPQVDIQANFSDGPISITYNSPAIISWTSTNADTCSVSPGNFPNLPNNPGGTPSGNLTANTTFTLTCNGPGGTATDSVEVRILGVTLTAFPNSGNAPLNNVTLTATTTGGSIGTYRYFFDCTNDGINESSTGDIPDYRYTASELCNYPSSGTYTARVLVYHSWGTAVGTATVNVSAPGAPTLTLTPNPMNLTVGGLYGNFTLRYDPDGSGPSSSQTVCSGGIGCSLPGSTWSSANTSIATVMQAGRTFPVNVGSTTVTATYAGLSAQATVNVTAAPVVPTANLIVNGETDDDVTITPGGNGSYVWTSTNATSGSSTLTISPSSPDPCGNTNSDNWVITGTSSNPLNPLSGSTCSTAGGYTYTIVYTVTGPGGSAFDEVIIRLRTVTPTPTPLSSIELDFYANPNQGLSPLNSTLMATVSGTATGTINYSFWWNCTSSSNSVSTVTAVCGLLPITTIGTCSANSVGYRCRAIDADSQEASTAYSPAGTYTGKVIVERGGLRDEARTTITVTAPNLPPTVSSVTAIQPNYCVSGPAATVNWTYSDPEGNPQSAYQVQVDNIGSAWNLPLTIDTGKISGSGASYFTGNGIPPWVWNTTYKSRVRAWDSNNAVSNWSESGSWTTPKHSYPVVNFTWSPLLDPSANQPIQFTDQTQLFDTSGVGQRAWNWLFGDGGSSAIQNPSHNYSSPGTFNVTETVTDKDGYTCALTKPIGIERPIPIWKEVSPK